MGLEGVFAKIGDLLSLKIFCGNPIEQVLLRNQKLPENHQNGFFRALLFTMHLVCSLLIVVHFFGAVFFCCPAGLWCYACVLVITFGLFSQWNCWFAGGGGTWFVSWCFNRAVVVLLGVVFPGLLLRGLIRPLFGCPKATNPNNLQHILSSTEII